MKAGAVLGDAGEEVGGGSADEKEGEGSPDPGSPVVPAVDEIPGGGDEESGAESPEEDRDGRPAADGAGCDVGDLAPDRDQGGAVGGVLVQEQGEADAAADGTAELSNGDRDKWLLESIRSISRMMRCRSSVPIQSCILLIVLEKR